MKNLTELLESKDVGTTEGLVNLFVSAAVRGVITTFVFLRSRRNCICCYKSFTKVEFKQTQLNNIQEA